MSEQTSTITGVPEWDLADRMRKALRSSGVGVSEMADYLDVGRNTVSTWINGRITPSKQTQLLWAMRCGVDPDWLQTGATPDTGPDTPGGLANQTSLCMTDDLAAIRARRSTALLPSTVAA